jgi:hypothetical protein
MDFVGSVSQYPSSQLVKRFSKGDSTCLSDGIRMDWMELSHMLIDFVHSFVRAINICKLYEKWNEFRRVTCQTEEFILHTF